MDENILPYFEERRTPVDMLVLHCSAFPAAQLTEILGRYRCSCHYIVDLDGSMLRVVEEDKSAWHAGAGYWRGIAENLNSRSIGIEVCNMSLGQREYDERQIAAVISLCREIVERYGIDAVNVVGHSDIAPQRKADPGRAFPWERLAREGIGRWFRLSDADKMAEDDATVLLQKIGYDTRNEAAFKASAYAFCRHFLPGFVRDDEPVSRLVENVLPDNFDFMQEDDFLNTLKAVAFAYK